MPGVIEQVGRYVDIEPAVAVVVAEGRHDARVLHVETVGVGHLLERPVALVDVEQVRGVEAADVDVEQSVVVDVDECGPAVPDAGLGADPGLLRDILEFVAAEVAEQPAAPGLAYDKDVRPAVAVVVPDRHAGADRAVLELVVELPPHLGVVVMVLGPDPRLLRLKLA
jgi:hypothetical protein